TKPGHRRCPFICVEMPNLGLDEMFGAIERIVLSETAAIFEISRWWSRTNRRWETKAVNVSHHGKEAAGDVRACQLS
ncbi:MAG TPA: hypothetical protein VFQ02_07870, partial [Nitrospira sp.]|nr:hypothetical protein [Nitrospira sp.]